MSDCSNYPYDCDGWDCDCSIYQSRNKNAPVAIHIMNKDESKVLRRLMSEIGMTEEEVRTHKKYRKMLSDAQVKGQKRLRSRNQKLKDMVMKDITRELKLSKEHPKVIERYKVAIKGYEKALRRW